MPSIHCYTNLDKYSRSKWPSMTVSTPRLGDYVKDSSGNVLKIVRITHTLQTIDRTTVHILEIELHN